jgi:hypothetical protein
MRRNGQIERFFEKVSYPSEWIMRAKSICPLTATSLYYSVARLLVSDVNEITYDAALHYTVCLLQARCASRGYFLCFAVL